MRSNPSYRWKYHERLELLAEMAQYLSNAKAAGDSSLMYRAMSNMALISKAPRRALEAQRATLLAFPYSSPEEERVGHVRSKLVIVTTKVEWKLYDGEKLCQDRVIPVILPAGQHKFERIQNPFPLAAPDFLALRGTKIGVAEDYWKRQRSGELGDYQVVIEDDRTAEDSLLELEAASDAATAQ